MKSSVSEDDVLITEQLFLRPPKPSNLQVENQALRMLGRQLTKPPKEILKHLVETALELCQAGTAGVSLIEATGRGEEVFRWVTLAGAYERYEGGTIQYDFSPCGVCLRRGGPQLYSYPERYFTYQKQFEPTVVEVLTVPLVLDGRGLGTIWIMSHDEQRQFDGEDLRVMTSLADFTAAALCSTQSRHAAEDMSRCEQAARAEAEAANRAKDEFLSIVSHELRTPLTAILLWAELLSTETLDAATATQAVKTIERNAKLQSQLIEDLLDISRIVTGNLCLNVDLVELVPVVQAAIDTLRLPAEAKGIQLQTVLNTEVGQVLGDAPRLQQVVSNLLDNAIKFTPNGGQVKIQLARRGTEVWLVVSDTGQGIGSEFLPYVFDRFRQKNSTTSRSQRGLGLGLAIVRNLVELHGGIVQVESPGEGQGTTFTVILPLVATSGCTSDGERIGSKIRNEQLFDNSLLLNGSWVLVVDDEADICEAIALVLRQYGAEVIAVTSIDQALKAIVADESGRRPDVLLCDIGMPGEDGYTLLRKVRALEAEHGGRIPIAALTAYAKEEDRRQALLAGFQLHVPKPVSPAQLVAVVANLSGRTAKL